MISQSVVLGSEWGLLLQLIIIKNAARNNMQCKHLKTFDGTHFYFCSYPHGASKEEQ
jgi:hypothetical protein